jgi:hypothetical protein
MSKTASAALASLTMMIGCAHAGELGQDDESWIMCAVDNKAIGRYAAAANSCNKAWSSRDIFTAVLQRASKDCLVLRNSEGIARANADGERFQAEGRREFSLDATLEGPIPPTDEALAEACRAIGAEMDAIEIWNQEAAGR